MKRVFHSSLMLMIFMSVAAIATAQSDKANRPSPPAEAKGKIGEADIMIAYSSPSVKDRKIWGELVPYNQVWRTGANEATVFTTSEDVVINGSKLPAGRYSLYTIPGEEKWTVIFNSVPDQWGTKYDQTKDVLRVEAMPVKGEFQERMKFVVEGDQVVLAWENLRLPLTIKTQS